MNDNFDEFRARIEAEIAQAYEAGKISKEFEPYFEWKATGAIPTLQQLLTMESQAATEREIIWESEQPDPRLELYYDYLAAELVRLEKHYRTSR